MFKRKNVPKYKPEMEEPIRLYQELESDGRLLFSYIFTLPFLVITLSWCLPPEELWERWYLVIIGIFALLLLSCGIVVLIGVYTSTVSRVEQYLRDAKRDAAKGYPLAVDFMKAIEGKQRITSRLLIKAFPYQDVTELQDLDKRSVVWFEEYFSLERERDLLLMKGHPSKEDMEYLASLDEDLENFDTAVCLAAERRERGAMNFLGLSSPYKKIPSGMLHDERYFNELLAHYKYLA